MTILIPIKDNPNHSFNIDLDNRTYNFSFVYNEEFSFWAMTIADDAGNIILAGHRLVANFYILKNCNNPSLPAGELICEVAAKNLDLTRDVFKNGQAKLVYFSEVEIAAL